MANPLYESMMAQNVQSNNTNPMSSFLQSLQQLKSSGGNPNQMIQNLINSGRVTQQQYNDAVQKAQMIRKMLNI